MGTRWTRLSFAKGVLKTSELNCIGVSTRFGEVTVLSAWTLGFMFLPTQLSCKLSYHGCQQPGSLGTGTATSSPSLKVYNDTHSKV